MVPYHPMFALTYEPVSACRCSDIVILNSSESLAKPLVIADTVY